jgi:hypothetical protein
MTERNDPGASSRHLAELGARLVLTYREVQALGICAERTLRRLVAMQKVRRSVLRTGKRVKFLKDALLMELQSTP